jgi:hypothetical protein
MHVRQMPCLTCSGLQVMQLTWTGQSQHMASVANQPPALLAGALADSLLLVRQNPVTGQDEVSCARLGEAGSVGLEYCN